MRATEILLVDDNPADTDLTSEVLSRNGCPSHIHAVVNGADAIALLRREGKYANAIFPDFMILDLNLPKKDGRAVLAEVKADPVLRKIPIAIFSTSEARQDIVRSYELGANCYVSKPGNLRDFISAVTSIGEFWFGTSTARRGTMNIDGPMNNGHTHVLLIEDNPGDADLVRLRLIEGDSGVNVSSVNRLADGLASMAKEPPSVVLLDLNLPDSHGADTFRKVLEQAPGVPVVILSGQDDEVLAMKALHQGVQDYLVKGDITSNHLERAMRYAIERQALIRSLEMSRQQQLEFKNQFLSHVSHELRTPLTCIHQFVTILLDGLAGDINPEQRYHLGIVLNSVHQLRAMIRDLLEATRAESGKIRIEPRCITIGASSSKRFP
jgi:two-component system, chemotaxis family, response regulator Rcp1